MFRTSSRSTTSSYITPLTDISANIFAMMIMILLLAMISQQIDKRAQVAADSEFSLVERNAMTASQLVQHLYERRNQSPALRIDVRRTGPFIADSEGNKHGLDRGEWERALTAQLQAEPSAPVRLYVFSHEWYPRLARTLHAAGRSWQEISVPQALASADRTAWSEKFEALLGQPIDRKAFRIALAQLLAASDSQAKPRDNAVRKSPFSVSESLSSRLARWWQGTISLMSLLIAFAFVIWVERHR